MREVVYHYDHPADVNSALRIVPGEPGVGGAPEFYDVQTRDGQTYHLPFQTYNGPVDALTNEVLLAIVADRLEGFQNGPFACQENSDALANVTHALRNLHRRTQKRIQQGVEGKMQQHDLTKTADGKQRIRVEGDNLMVDHTDGRQGRTLRLEYVRTQWRAWGQIEDVVKHYDPKITDEEMKLLASLATEPPSKNGFSELSSALQRCQGVRGAAGPAGCTAQG